MKKIKLLTIIILFCCKSPIFAYHPLITDDTGTQGNGKFQIELNSEYSSDKTYGTEKNWQTSSAILYGVTENTDIIVGIPYLYYKTDETSERGISDASIELKWKFFSSGPFSLALKPGITLPTGDEKKGLGQGKSAFRSFLISTADFNPLALHFNIGYALNRNSSDEQIHLWHLSAAAEYQLAEGLKILANIGIDRNPDKTREGLSKQPAFLLAGIIYSVKENFDIDFAAKYGLNSDAADMALTAGIAFRF